MIIIIIVGNGISNWFKPWMKLFAFHLQVNKSDWFF